MWATTVQLTVQAIDSSTVYLKVNSPDLPYYAVPNDIFPAQPVDPSANLTDLDVALNASAFQITMGKSALSGNATINTLNRKLLVSSKYSEMGLIVPTRRLFGLGQRNGKFKLDSGSYTMLARGREEFLPAEDYLGGKQGNHIHPFILGQTDDKSFFGIFYANTGVQHFEIIHFTKFDNAVINYIHLGPNIEIYFLFGKSASEVVMQYHKMILNEFMPPYFALGVFQGSPLLNSEAAMNQMLADFTASGIHALEGLIVRSYNEAPLQEFTISATKFPTIKDTMTTIRASNKRVIWGISSAISVDPSYHWYA
jgi:alpha-glucosidase (family GH31 glycosyl hydrolase)